MSIFSDVGDWFSGNSGWLKPFTQLVSGAGTQYQQSKNQEGYLNLLRQQEQANYDQSKANYDSYAAYAAGQGGGGDGGASAAAAANEAGRQKAAKKANKTQQKGFQQIQEIWNPYVETGKELLPIMSNIYKGGAENVNTMNQKFKTPEFQQSMNQGMPSWMVNVPLPDHLKGAR